MVMKTLVTVTFIVISISANAQYNFESCHAFWKLTDKLRTGITPSEQDWKHLRNTEGHKQKDINDAYWNSFVEAV